MEATTLTLHQAGKQLGVDDTTLTRLIRVGGLPEARKISQPHGMVWMVPEKDLPAIAKRNGWTIDLRDGAKELLIQEPASPPPAEDRGQQAGGSVVASPADNGGAIEVTTTPEPETADGAMVPSNGTVTSAAGASEDVQKMVEALDLALLERLLEAQEGRVSAEVVAQENKHALAALNINHNRATAELDVERRERMVAADRFREERLARAVADAKVAELRDRLTREMEVADLEKEARSEALARSIRAERDAANAVAAMGWRARRRYRKLNAMISEQVVTDNAEGQATG